MLELYDADILSDGSDLLVNTVNCVGVMGKGVALQFKKAFPENYRLYRAACDAGELRPGEIFVTVPGGFFGPREIANASTKDHWRDQTKLEWVVSCATKIRRHCEERGFSSVGMPPLGCTNGRMTWTTVGPILRDIFSGSDIRLSVFHQRA